MVKKIYPAALIALTLCLVGCGNSTSNDNNNTTTTDNASTTEMTSQYNSEYTSNDGVACCW